MRTVLDASRDRFAKLADGDAKKLPCRKGMGKGSLFIGRKMFGVLDENGSLALKLPSSRVQELIAAGTGLPWHPGAGNPLREYVAIGFANHALWLGLAKEAREYTGSRR